MYLLHQKGTALAMELNEISTRLSSRGYLNIQSNLYLEVTFGTKKKWPYKTGDLLKEVEFI